VRRPSGRLQDDIERARADFERVRANFQRARERTSELSARNAGVSGKVLLVTRAVAPVATYALVNEEPRR
jgi:hypothetical protein